MTTDELNLLVKSLAPAVHGFVTKTVSGLTDRMVALEQRMASVRDGRDGAAGRDGKDAQEPDIDAIVLRAAALIPVPKDGAVGPPGDRGERGPGITVGVGVPAAEGLSGDVYLDAKSGDIYSWR